VLEKADMVAGPYCTKLLAGLGAEVIKIEAVGTGDKARTAPPFLDGVPHPERSGLFAYLNTDKLSITLNLKTETGRHILERLIQETDIFVAAHQSGTMEELGIEYRRLSQINPRLIMTSITPFGMTGPYKDYKGSDLIANSTGGLAIITPLNAEDPEKPPLKPGGHFADFFIGVIAAGASLAAVAQRRLSGTGQHIDLSQQEAIAYIILWPIMYYNAERHIVRRTDAPRMAPRHLIPCKDGHVWIQIIQPGEAEWQRFCQWASDADWATNELFKVEVSRAQYWDALKPLLSDWAMSRTKEDFVKASHDYHLTFEPLNPIEEVVNHRHLAARDFFVEIEHPEIGKVKYPGPPYKLSQTPWQVTRAAPRLGEHNEEIYVKRLGFSHQELVQMRAGGVI